MKFFFLKFKTLLFIFFIMNFTKINAENYSPADIYDQQSQILIEADSQKSDLINSIFYAEGDVIITNERNEFIAKAEKAIFYKLDGKIKLIGNVEIVNNDSSEIRAGEVIYFIRENKFEAISGLRQKVSTKFSLDTNDISN